MNSVKNYMQYLYEDQNRRSFDELTDSERQQIAARLILQNDMSEVFSEGANTLSLHKLLAQMMMTSDAYDKREFITACVEDAIGICKGTIETLFEELNNANSIYILRPDEQADPIESERRFMRWG